MDVEKEDDLEKDLKGQRFKIGTGGHSRDSDWKGAGARKRHRMSLSSKRKGRRGFGSLFYHVVSVRGGRVE
jgi:hypothetical protein